MRHHCRHCHAASDFISTVTTKCPECAPAASLTNDGEWVHVSTQPGAIADRRALEAVRIGQASQKKNAG